MKRLLSPRHCVESSTCHSSKWMLLCLGTAGDCDGNSSVSIAEVQQVINCYLGLTSCTGGCGTCP